MKDSLVKSFLLKTLTLIIILVILCYYLYQFDTNGLNNSNEIKRDNNTSLKNEVESPPFKEIETKNSKKDNITKENQPVVINNKLQSSKDIQIRPEQSKQSENSNNLVSEPTQNQNSLIISQNCQNVDYVKIMNKYQLNQDFKYILQAYCESADKTKIKAYQLIANILEVLKETSFISEYDICIIKINQLAEQWEKIVYE